MKKGMLRLIAICFIAGSFITGTSYCTAKASDTFSDEVSLENKIIELNTLIDMAIKNNSGIKTCDFEISKLKKQEDIIELKEDELNYDATDEEKDMLRVQINQQKQKKEFLVDKVASDIMDKYNNIIISQREIKSVQNNLELKEQNLKDTEIKKQLGIIAEVNLDSSSVEIESIKNDIISKQKTLESNISYLGQLTGMDLSGYNFNTSLKFEPLRITQDIDSYIDEQIDTYFKYNEMLLGITKDSIDDLEDDDLDREPHPDFAPKPVKPIMPTLPSELSGEGALQSYVTNLAGYFQRLQQYEQQLAIYNGSVAKFTGEINAYSQYIQMKCRYDSSILSMQDGKRDLKKTLIDNYNSLNDLENTINILYKQVDIMNTRLEQANIQKQLGLMTNSQYAQMINSAKELQDNLYKCVYNYNKLRSYVEKPWVMLVK